MYTNLMKTYDVDSDKGYILEVDVEYPKNCIIFIMIFHF